MRSATLAAVAIGLATAAAADPAAVPEGACPVPDARDTVQTVVQRATARLGDPFKSEVVDDQVIFTYRLKTGVDVFVTVTREDGKLVVTCDSSQR